MVDENKIAESETYKMTRIFTTSAGAEAVSSLLLSFGVDGVSVDDIADIDAVLADGNGAVWASPDADAARRLPEGQARPLTDSEKVSNESEQGKTNSPEVIVTYYTTDDEAGEELISQVVTGLMKLKADEQYGDYGESADFGRLYAETEIIGDEWKTKWKENFKPFQMTDRFTVCPPWEMPVADTDDGAPNDIIIIDPGMAFGTGSHETTAMCASALENNVDASSVVLDIGTGSGILAIVAAKCGARAVTGLDIDEDALRSASENIEHNGVSQTISLIRGDVALEAVRELLISANTGARFDVICANLTSGILKELLPVSTTLLADSGIIILSGILETERADMLDAVDASGMKVILEEVRGEWLMLCAGFL
jgi:ribosomal protein L11 methyltransferase